MHKLSFEDSYAAAGAATPLVADTDCLRFAV